MIEIIYKDETKKDNTDTVIKLPKNIRQIGEGNSDYQIYVENTVIFSDEVWTSINDNIRRYFKDLKVVGCIRG